MSNIGDSERKTQNRVIDFFKNTLHYTYIGNLSEQENSNIIENKLSEYFKGRGYSEWLISGAIDELKKTSLNLQQGLYSANKEVYSLLKYGAKVKEDVDKPAKTVYFIDFDDIGNNDFYIAEEVTVVGNNTKRPDLVVYVNGIALAVIELKNSKVSVANGIRQNITNQKTHFIEKFFTTMQFCVAGNESEGMRYGTLLTPEKYYLEWKEDGFKEFSDECDETDLLIAEKCKDIEGKLFKELFCLFYKKRFLDLIHNFVIFDKGIKKVCRYNQYYAIKRAQKRLTDKNRGGIIWHTQGSGKSLSMVWLSKWILANNPNARVLVITDREELDEQIEKIYIKEGTLFFHCAKAGHKLDALRRCSKASFCVIDQDQVVPPEYTTYFRSVIAFGRTRILEDEAEKQAAIWLLAEKYCPGDSPEHRQEAIRREAGGLCLVSLSIEHMTGKQAIELVQEDRRQADLPL